MERIKYQRFSYPWECRRKLWDVKRNPLMMNSVEAIAQYI